MNSEIMKKYSPAVLRIGLGIVFLWFGLSQIKSPGEWIVFLPSWISFLGIPATTFVYMNGIFEIVLGFFMLLGLYVRFSALLLSLHLFGIAFAVGYNAIAVRDFGLAVATFAVFLNGRDVLCLKKKVYN